MKMHHLVAALVCLSAAVAAQTEILIDFGTPTYPSAPPVAQWNDVVPGVVGPLGLIDATGLPSGASLAFTPGMTFTNANPNGTTSPTSGSPMDGLAWPVSALRDYMYGQASGAVEFVISGLDPTKSYDFTVVASRLSVNDVRTADYEIIGTNSWIVTLDAAGNTSQIGVVPAIAPTATGDVTVRLTAAASNTTPSGFFYLNALGLRATTGGPITPAIGLSPTGVSAQAIPGALPFVEVGSLITNDGTSPTVTLSAIDSATGSPPSWLTLPSTSPVGPFTMTIQPAGLPIGSFAALVTASAAGYVSATIPVTVSVVAPSPGKKLLFYGNSYSLSNQTMPDIVDFIAAAAGHDRPVVVKRLAGGTNLAYHLNDPTQAAAITGALPHGETWDFVVLQGFSLEATSALGDPAAFRANAAAIHGNVRAHSPNARAAMFQTWARGPGNGYYPGTFEDPSHMHSQIRTGYQAAVADINALHGPDTARIGAVGDGFAHEGFPLDYYTSDLSHPSPRASLLAGMVMYTTIYRDLVSCLRPDFTAGGLLVNRLSALGLGELDWVELAEVADRVAALEAQPRPGSGADLDLVTTVSGVDSRCPTKLAGDGDHLELTVDSPHGDYFGLAVLIAGQVLPAGGAPSAYPGLTDLHLDATAVVIASTPSWSGPLTVSGTILPVPVPVDVWIQGLSLSPAPSNTVFTTTNAHVIELR